MCSCCHITTFLCSLQPQFHGTAMKALGNWERHPETNPTPLIFKCIEFSRGQQSPPGASENTSQQALIYWCRELGGERAVNLPASLLIPPFLGLLHPGHPETSWRQILVASYPEDVQKCLWIGSGRAEWQPKPISEAVLWRWVLRAGQFCETEQWGASEPTTNRRECGRNRRTETPKPDQKRARYGEPEAKSYSWSLMILPLYIFSDNLKRKING